VWLHAPVRCGGAAPLPSEVLLGAPARHAACRARRAAALRAAAARSVEQVHRQSARAAEQPAAVSLSYRGCSWTGRSAPLSSCAGCPHSQELGCGRAWCSGAPRLVSRRRYCSAAARQQEATVPGTSVSPTRTAGPHGASARRDVSSRTRTVRLCSRTQQA